MASVTPLHRAPAPEPPALHVRAMDNLAFIRNTMEAAGSFTAVSGWGMVAIGVLAIIASVVASMQASPEGALGTWVGLAVFSPILMVYLMIRKSRRAKMPLLSGPGRKFV